MKKLSDVSFLVWLACFIIFMVFGSEDVNGDAMLALVLVGSCAFCLFWIVSIAWASIDKEPLLRAFFLPILSVLIVTSTILWAMEYHQTPPKAEEVVQKTAPTPTPTPTPIKQVKQASKPVVTKIECVGPDGVHFQTTQKECDDFNNAWNNTPKPAANNQPVKNTQPSYDYDYQYYPTYTYSSNYVPLSVPSIPTYSTYTPSYPTANITVAPMPTIKSIPNTNCETYTTNGGTTTICR